MKKGISIYYFIIAAVTAVYLYLTFNTPSDPVAMERYHLTAQGIFLLRVSFIIPILFIWLAGTYAFVTLTNYIKLVHGSWEEDAFRKMRTGIGILFWGGIVTASLVNVIGNYIGHGISNYPLKPVFTIISNYFAVLPMLLGFAFIFISARIFLAHVTGAKKINLAVKLIIGLVLSVVAYVCLGLIFSDNTRLVPGPSGVATYYLDDGLIILTIIIPLFVSWVIGLIATNGLATYGNLVEGKIYKSLFANLSLGLNSLIFLSIFLRTLTSIGTGRIASLGFTSIILLIYLIFLIMGVAYLFIAIGARKLSRIELA